jgi:hypothetical protein
MSNVHVTSKDIFLDQTTTGASAGFRAPSERSFQAHGVTSSGSGAATVKVQVSNDNANWIDLGTISLTLGTTRTTDGFASVASWCFVRGNVTAISGTGAKVSLVMGF